VQRASPPEIDRWVPQLEQWDSQNALPHFIVAETIDIDQVVREKIPHRVEEQPPAWQNALAAAFQSPKIDNYLGRLKELDRRILLRYHVDDPFQILGIDRWYGLPSYTAWDTSRYAKSLLESGQTLEAQGNRKGAFEKYWTVARFGQMIGPSGGFFVRRELQEAYTQLGALSEKEGNKVEAMFYSSLANQTDIAQREESIALRKRLNGSDVSHWNAFLVRLSGVTILFSGGLLTICAFAVNYDRSDLRADDEVSLGDKRSDLYCFLFDSTCLPGGKGRSVYEKLSTAHELGVKVVDGGRSPRDGNRYALVLFYDRSTISDQSLRSRKFLCKESLNRISSWSFKFADGKWQPVTPLFDNETDTLCSPD